MVNFLIMVWVILSTGFLSYNPKLEATMRYRQSAPVEYSIDKRMHPEDYECLVGVPYGLGFLIGKEVHFIKPFERKTEGPWLVVDVENEKHKGIMSSRLLAADINCKDQVHSYGSLIMLYNSGIETRHVDSEADRYEGFH